MCKLAGFVSAFSYHSVSCKTTARSVYLPENVVASAESHSGDETAQGQGSQKATPKAANEEAVEEGDRGADEGAAETETALAAAQEAQQQAVQAQQQALAEERSSLMQLRQDLQQQSGQFQQTVRRQTRYIVLY